MLLVIFKGSLRVDAGIFTVGTLGSESFFGKSEGSWCWVLLFLHAVFLFFYFFGGRKGRKEISEIEILKKNRSSSYRDFSCKKCGKTLQGCPVKQGSLIKSSNPGFQGRAVKLQGWKSLFKSPCIPLSLRGGAASQVATMQPWGKFPKKTRPYLVRSCRAFMVLFKVYGLIQDYIKTRWWQLKCFLSSPRKLGKMNPFWRAYFSKGLVQPPSSTDSLSSVPAFPGSFCSSWCWWVVSAWYHFIRNFP